MVCISLFQYKQWRVLSAHDTSSAAPKVKQLHGLYSRNKNAAVRENCKVYSACLQHPTSSEVNIPQATHCMNS